MRQISQALAVALALSGCAQPMLELHEPDTQQLFHAKRSLNSTTLAEPRRPLTLEAIEDGLRHAFARVVVSATKVCMEMEPTMTDLRCDEAISKPEISGDEAVNAYADQFDTITLNAGLLLEVRVEAELAAVLAHEYAHVMLGHIEKKYRNAMAGMAIASGLAGIYAAKTGANPETFAESWQRAGALAGSRAYSPEMEIEADRLAVYILKEAGYPPTAMRDVIVRMHRIVPERRRGAFAPKRVGFLETHPSNDRRIAHILSAIRDAKAGVPLRARRN